MKDQSSSTRQPSAGVHVVQPDHLGNILMDIFHRIFYPALQMFVAKALSVTLHTES